MKTNLHSHTQFCDGRNSMEELLIAADKEDFKIWGFSPHGPIGLDSPCNMKKEDVRNYLAEIERLRPLFPDINILAGMEVDYIDDTQGPSSPHVKDYGLDYVIGSIHFIPNQKGEYFDIDGSPERFKRYLKDYFENDLNYVVQTFWEQTLKMISQGGLDIIGHIDKIALNASFINPDIEKDNTYLSMANRAIDLAIEKRIAIEINTKHWKKYGRFFPHPRFWKKIKDAGIRMPVNSDAHYSEKISDGIPEALKLLSNIES